MAARSALCTAWICASVVRSLPSSRNRTSPLSVPPLVVMWPSAFRVMVAWSSSARSARVRPTPSAAVLLNVRVTNAEPGGRTIS